MIARIEKGGVRRMVWSWLVVGLLLGPTGASGAAPAAPDLLLPASAPGALAAATAASVVRERLVTVDLGLLFEADGSPRGQAGQGGAVQLDLFDDARFTAVLDAVTRTSPVGYAWSGHLAGVDMSSVVLVVERDVMAGHVAMPGAIYQIRAAGGGLHVVSEIDQSRFPPEAAPRVVHDADVASAPDAEDAGADDGSLIDVLVLYTAAARLAAGGTAAMNSEVDLAIATTNNTYANSGVVQRLRLVYKGEVVYTETGAIDTDLTRLTSPFDGFMDSAHTLRNTYNADLVSLIVENGGGFCGIANLMTSVSAGFASQGFNVIVRTCASANYSFPHELGHNMAARHDWYVDPTNGSPYTYNHGYVNPTAAWRTVMAYNNRCSDFGFNCTRLPYWSNPNLLYGGAPMGVPEGSFQAADNRKTLTNTGFTVANFRVSSAPPPATTLIAPSGTVMTNLPAYQWNAVGTATYYYLWVNGPAGTAVVTQWFSAAEAGCGGGTGTCSVTPSTALAGGTHRWWVETWNPAGAGPWSSPLDFTVVLPPPVTTLISPSGSITDDTPTYVWNAVSSASYYYLWVNNSAGTPVIQQWFSAAAAGCGSGTGTCGATPAGVLAQGSYRWWVATWNAAGYGPFSSNMDFTVIPPPTALIAPSGSTSDNTPTYSWTAVAAASYYYLWVNGPAGTAVITQWFTPAAAGCGTGTGTCAVASATVLGAGTHRWWVATWNAVSGYGPWSNPLDFTVSGPPAATLLGPSGAISDTTPTYSWTAVGPATYYYLYVRGPSGTAVLTQWYTAAAAGCGAGTGTCAVTPSTALTGSGTYRWWIQTWNVAGLGAWSSSLTFSLP